MSDFHPLDLMEPEETVGNLWHGYASELAATRRYEAQAVCLSDIRASVALLLRALGGEAGVEIGESAATASDHRIGIQRKLGTVRETVSIARYDGERLRLPVVMDAFPDAALNRAAYLWLTALAAVARVEPLPADAFQADLLHIGAMRAATDEALRLCPGLHAPYAALSGHIRANRNCPFLPASEAMVETMICDVLSSRGAIAVDANSRAPRGYHPMKPVPIWLHVDVPQSKTTAPRADEDAAKPPAGLATTRKTASRENRDEANRKDSFIIHRFEAILSWAESMNLNRSVDDDDDEDAQKAADDQDHIALSRHDRRAATKLRLHLDLSPEDAEHERLAGLFTYPEWNHRTRAYMADHCRVLDTDASSDTAHPFVPDARRLREVRRQFEALHPRRIMRPRQIEGSELDLDALIAAQVDLRATGRSSDRIYQSLRQMDRDLSVAFLLDTSRSTEAAVDGDNAVIDIGRDALAALAGGIDASGDRLSIWGFSSLKRDRVFLKRCKNFDAPMSSEITAKICALTPCHYTRLGAAIRHASAMLDAEQSTRKLLLILTDGKPNDLDHYEGVHGIEDSHMAVREARRLGHTVHGIVIDRDGQDWFARIFGRGGFTLLPDPSRLSRALPDIYRSLTQEI